MNVFKPNVAALQQLKDLGIPDNAAMRGLLLTGNADANLAAEWCMEHLDDANFDSPITKDEFMAISSAAQLGASFAVQHELRVSSDNNTPLELAFIVNSGLGMGAGKIASQVSHAATGIWEMLRPLGYDISVTWLPKDRKALVLKGKDDAQLREVAERARQARLAVSLMRDAGLTQVAPGSLTVVGIFGEAAVVGEVIKNLPAL